MKTPSSPNIKLSENRPSTTEPGNVNTRHSRRSHVSISSNKRASVNTGSGHTTQNKQGMFHRAVPQMPRALAFLCFILNLVLPGTGINILLRKII